MRKVLDSFGWGLLRSSCYSRWGVQDLSEPRLSYHAKLHVYKSSLCAAVGWGLWYGAVDEIYKQEFSTARKILVPHIRGMSPEDARR